MFFAMFHMGGAFIVDKLTDWKRLILVFTCSIIRFSIIFSSLQHFSLKVLGFFLCQPHEIPYQLIDALCLLKGLFFMMLWCYQNWSKYEYFICLVLKHKTSYKQFLSNINNMKGEMSLNNGNLLKSLISFTTHCINYNISRNDLDT